MKTQVPRGKPRELPLIGHRNDIAGEEMGPFMVASCAALVRGRRFIGISLEPVRDNVVVVLFRPEHAGKGLPRYELFVFGKLGWKHNIVEFIRFILALQEQLIEFIEGVLHRLAIARGRKAQIECQSLAWLHSPVVSCGRFGPGGRRVHRLVFSIHHIPMKRVFEVRR